MGLFDFLKDGKTSIEGRPDDGAPGYADAESIERLCMQLLDIADSYGLDTSAARKSVSTDSACRREITYRNGHTKMVKKHSSDKGLLFRVETNGMGNHRLCWWSKRGAPDIDVRVGRFGLEVLKSGSEFLYNWHYDPEHPANARSSERSERRRRK